MDKSLQVKVYDLRQEVERLREDFECGPLTRMRVEIINSRLMDVFTKYGLEDLQWRLLVDQDDGTITFDPIRVIDKLAWESITDFNKIINKEF